MTKTYHCDVENCDKHYTRTNALNHHKALSHGIGTPKQQICPECNKDCKTVSKLRKHKEKEHGLGIKTCPECNIKFNSCDLKRHMKIHDEDRQKTFKCDQCEEKYYDNYKLQIHMMTHLPEEEKVWYNCDKCTYKSLYNDNITEHNKIVHLKIKNYFCDCGFSCYNKRDHARHLSDIHNINVTWHECTFPMCDFKTKRKRILTSHHNSFHTIEGIARRKKKEEEVSKLLVDSDITFERESRIDFKCYDTGKKYAYIDFVIYKKDYVILLEVDENQHKYGYDSIACDMKRMNHIIVSLMTIHENDKRDNKNILSKFLFVRYNPDKYKIDGIKTETSKEIMQEKLVNVINNYEPKSNLEIIYLYYDAISENEKPLICKSDEYHSEMEKCVRVV
jgi:hypothetical protein